MLNLRRAPPGSMLRAMSDLSVIKGRQRDMWAAGDSQKAFAAELLALAQRFNRSGDETFVGPGEYVEVVITV